MRRFNYTGRLRMNRSDVTVTLYPREDGGLEYETSVALTEIAKAKAPPNAAIFLEAYSRTKFERVDLGTLGSPEPQQRRKLASFRQSENPLFRLKVVEADDHTGRIIAMASGIRATAPDESRQSSLLPVSVEPLDDLVYRVDFSEEGPPTLRLNQGLDASMEQGIKAIVRTPLFLALVLPEVVRQILTRILVVEGDGDMEDEDDTSSWSAKWRRYARSLNPEPIPELESEDDKGRLLDWIDVAVSRVGRDLNVIQRFQQGLAE